MQARFVARWALALIYLIAGGLHLAVPDVFLSIMPYWVPYPRPVVLGTGVAEIAGAIGLLAGRGRLRRAAGIGLALYAVCVVPANIKHAIDGLPAGAIQLGWWYHGPRLALQPVLVWWALYVGEVTDWPRGRRFANARPLGPGAATSIPRAAIPGAAIPRAAIPEAALPGAGLPGAAQITPSAFSAAISASVLPSKPL